MVHLLGLVMLVGAIGIVDLRLAGVFRTLAVVPLSRALTPVAIAGLLLMVPSGATMVAADAAVLQLPTFRWKIVLIGLALANAGAFRMIWRDRFGTWDSAPPVAGRMMAAGSILLWLTIGGLGRMIAYS